MSRPIKPGAVDQSTIITILDSTTFLPETAVEHNTAGIALWYRREGGLKVAITPVALAAADSAHSDGGIEHISDGEYRLDLPDAADAVGADGVQIGGTVTGMIVIGLYHPLNFITQANIESECNDALVALKLDKLISAAMDNADVADDSGIAQLGAKGSPADWDTHDNTTDSQEAQKDGGLSAADKADIGDAVLDEVYEGTTTLRQWLRLAAAPLFGLLSGAATTEVKMRNEADTQDRVKATVDKDGNRTSITLDKS